MHYLSCFSFTNPHILASLSNNTSHHNNNNPKLPLPKINTANSLTTTTKATTAAKTAAENHQQQKQKQKQPSVAEIERVIGAGIFRDRETSDRNSEQSKTLFDTILSNSVGKSEGSVEKKLRETGEWLIDRTENVPSSAGKNILTVMFLWILPIWILSFLVASGIINLPFSIPFLDDLIM